MNVRELKAGAPLAELYELKPDVRYLVVSQRHEDMEIVVKAMSGLNTARSAPRYYGVGVALRDPERLQLFELAEVHPSTTGAIAMKLPDPTIRVVSCRKGGGDGVYFLITNGEITREIYVGCDNTTPTAEAMGDWARDHFAEKVRAERESARALELFGATPRPELEQRGGPIAPEPSDLGSGGTFPDVGQARASGGTPTAE